MSRETGAVHFPNGIALFDGMLYWSDSGTTSINRSNLDGSGVTPLVSGLPVTQLPDDLFVTDQFIYWTTRDLALTQGGTPTPGTIQRANLDGTNMMTLITDLIFPQSLAVTNDFLYWTDMYAGKIQRADLTGAGKTDLIVGPVPWGWQ